MEYIVYKANTGEILRTGYGGEDSIEIQANSPNESVIPGDGLCRDDTHYVDIESSPPVIQDKSHFEIEQSLNVINTEDTVVFSNIPHGTIVKIDNETEVINDGVFEVGVNLKGEYTIKFNNLKYIEQEFTFEAQ